MAISSVSNAHSEYLEKISEWEKIRACLKGEKAIKNAGEKYLPRPAGMSGEYADAYDAYKERAHFPLICSYSLTGVLGVIITKMPQFNVPKGLEYIFENATKDGRSLNQLFLDIIIDIFITGRVPLTIDIVKPKNEFRFIQYKAEDFINWKTSLNYEEEKNIILAVFKQKKYTRGDEFSHETEDMHIVMALNEKGQYYVRHYNEKDELEKTLIPNIYGRTLDQLPITIAGSINNSIETQAIPLLATANCSIQIYRKEADLANSEFLSCNPTLVMCGVEEDEAPNVIGSSVLVTISDPTARVFYTKTDTAALTHVKTHINELYEEGIKHGVSILESRKGVEAAEALRIRQATQSASVYSVYLSAINAIKNGLLMMCAWGDHNIEEVSIDAPGTLTFGVPDSSVIKEVVEGFGAGVVPLSVIYKYLINSGLIEQTISYEEYLDLLSKDLLFKDSLNSDISNSEKNIQETDENEEENEKENEKNEIIKNSNKKAKKSKRKNVLSETEEEVEGIKNSKIIV